MIEPDRERPIPLESFRVQLSGAKPGPPPAGEGAAAVRPRRRRNVLNELVVGRQRHSIEELQDLIAAGALPVETPSPALLEAHACCTGARWSVLRGTTRRGRAITFVLRISTRGSPDARWTRGHIEGESLGMLLEVVERDALLG
jgi:hypothetical protein